MTECDNFEEAERVTNLIYKTLTSYLKGLYQLSEEKLTNYNTDALTKELKTGKFGKITINDKDVDAYSKIGKIVLKAFTDGYRKRKLKEYIGEANEPFQILITLFQTAVTNFQEILDFRKEKLHTIYNEILRGNISEYEKRKATLGYYDEIDQLNVRQKQISKYVQSLEKIAAAHRMLYDNRNKLSKKELRNLIIENAGMIQDIISEFNSLKN